MEYPSGALLFKALQVRHQHQSIADPVRATVLATGTVQNAVNALAITEAQKGLSLQQSLEVHCRGQADHFDVEPIGLIEAFIATELQHLQTQIILDEGQGEGTFLVVVHRVCFCQSYWAQRVRNHSPE